MTVTPRELTRLQAVDAAVKTYLEVHTSKPFDARKSRTARQKLADLVGFSPPPIPRRPKRHVVVGSGGEVVRQWWQKD